jgi:hypothetical protein
MNRDGQALHWTGRVLAEEDLRRNLNGHRAVVLAREAVITPSAREHLRASGIRLDHPREASPIEGTPRGFARDRPYPLVMPAVASLVREGFRLVEFTDVPADPACRWSHTVATCIARNDFAAGVVFCEDPGLVCCVANKVPGLRAAAVTTIDQATRAARTLQANLLAVEMPGRTYFEMRQILRILCGIAGNCPEVVAGTLRELDGHAHR